jgi:predicted ArsR family transcriptional regulator
LIFLTIEEIGWYTVEQDWRRYMQITHGKQRFFASTRGKIVTLLRRGSRTVEDLAEALDLTDNAVRAHLVALERDGLVQQRGQRRSNSKPASIYDLAQAAEDLFPKAYGQVLDQLLKVLGEQITPEEIELIMRTTGRRLAAQWHIPAGDLRVQLEEAVAILNELGGLAELEQQNEIYTIRGYSCPLAIVVSDHPEACCLASSLLAELIGIPVQEQCEHGEKASCRFLLSALPPVQEHT